MDIVKNILQLVGSLAFFLYGMKLMSEALQKVAGDKMRNILSAMTSNRFKGVLTGVLITAIIQSSSATTVMVVSFVNAGLLSLTQSIGVIMGANIGTTVTAWLISLLGFKVKISAFALPLLGLGIPFIFSQKSKRNSIGQVIVGFAILFMGLSFLKDAVPDIKGNVEVLEFIAQYSSYGYGSILIFLFVGTALTMIIQSSSAVMALTLVMCFNGWITFDMAAAMVLGENIGTTITANIAALVVNDTAKRAARAHLLFNIIGVVMILIVFRPFLSFVDWILVQLGQESPLAATGTSKEGHVVLTIALSVFHTTFNILNTFIQIWFIPYIEKLVVFMVPTKDDDDEIFKLNYISTALVSVDEIGLLQAKNEIAYFAKRTIKMYGLVKKLVMNPTAKNADKIMNKIRRHEINADKFEEEIATFITRSATNELSDNASENSSNMLKLVSRIESLNDSCFTIAEYINNQPERVASFSPVMLDRFQSLFEMVDPLVEQLNEIFNSKEEINKELIRNERDDIDAQAEKLNLQHLKDIKKGVYKYKVGMVYCDIFTEIASIGNHAYHVHKYVSDLGI